MSIKFQNTIIMITRSFAYILFCIFLSGLLLSCNTVSNHEEEKKEILSIMASMRDAHFESNAEKFLEPMLDSFIEVRSGSYMKLFSKESLPGVQSYFDSMEFLELEDTQEPIVEISEDASMASYIGSIVVKGNLQGDPVFNKFSWQSTLRKSQGQWKIIQNVNTVLPDTRMGSVVLDQLKRNFANLPDSLYVFARANCSGPTDAFETLVLSAKDDGRMEQSSSDGHLILQHGKAGSWMMDVSKRELQESLDPTMAGFITGHEFHWLCLRPEDRFHDPMLEGVKEFAGQKAFEVTFDDPLDRQVIFFYSFDDYRPLGFIYPSHRENEKIISQFLDWTEVDGIPVFQKVIIDENETRWEYNFTDIRLEHVTESGFDKKEALL